MFIVCLEEEITLFFRDRISNMLSHLSNSYPNFDMWLSKVFSELGINRKILLLCSNSNILGIAILKIDENKICTFFIDSSYKHKGYSDILMDHCLSVLPLAKLSIKASDVKYWCRIFDKYNFVFVEEIAINLYYKMEEVDLEVIR